jgi:hypothetical protein
MRWRCADQPVPLPVQALDHATGYLTAVSAIRGLTQRLLGAVGVEARLSLARTAKLLLDQGSGNRLAPPLAPESAADLCATVERTDWGDARRLIPPLLVEAAPMQWPYPATQLGSAMPQWMSLD